MVKIRLRRTGAKKQPHYRVVVADSKSPRDGKFIEIIGHYNPRTEPPTVEIDAQRALHWLSVGAQPSAAVKRMLDKMGLMSKVAAVRKGEESIDDILAQFVLTTPEAEEPAVAVDEADAVEEVVEEAPEVEAEEIPVDQVEPVEEAPEDEDAPEDTEALEEAPEDEAEPAGEDEDQAEDAEPDMAEEPTDLEDDEADDVDED